MDALMKLYSEKLESGGFHRILDYIQLAGNLVPAAYVTFGEILEDTPELGKAGELFVAGVNLWINPLGLHAQSELFEVFSATRVDEAKEYYLDARSAVVTANAARSEAPR